MSDTINQVTNAVTDTTSDAGSALSNASVWTHWINDKMVQLGAAVHDAAAKYGPKAEELVLAYARMDAASKIAVPLVLCVVFAIMLPIMMRLNKHARTVVDENRGGRYSWFDEEDMHCWLAILSGFFVLVCTVGIFVCLICALNFWAWVGLFHPELYLAHQGIEAITAAANAATNH